MASLVLTQRSADIAKKWFAVKTNEMIELKKQEEKLKVQIDYDELENLYIFSCSTWFCRIQYIIPDHLHLEFGYKKACEPDYMRKIICSDTFHEDSVSFTLISNSVDALVGKKIICSFCDKWNKIYDNGMCKHCYIFGTIHEDDDCAICLTKDFGVWLQTPCNHKFHYKCYNKIKEKVCPLCRTPSNNVWNCRILDA